jgi:hypothetical protein
MISLWRAATSTFRSSPQKCFTKKITTEIYLHKNDTKAVFEMCKMMRWNENLLTVIDLSCEL